VARPYSAPREKVWDMAIKQLVAQVFNYSCKSSHVNPLIMSVMAITKVRLAIFCTRNFDFYCVPAHDSRHFLLSILLMLLIHSLLKLKFLNFLVNQVSCDWILCCDWYTLHGAWRWTALWPCLRPFSSVRPHKTNIYQHLTHMVVQVPGISVGNDQCTTGLICPALPWHQML